MKAAERLSRVVRAFQDGVIEAEDYAEQRADLLAQREAAEAAVARAQKRSEAGSDEGVSDEVLERLRDLRAAVLGGLDRAPDLPALRKLLRQMFESVTFVPFGNRPGGSLVFGFKWHMINLDQSIIEWAKDGADPEQFPADAQVSIARQPLEFSESQGLGR